MQFMKLGNYIINCDEIRDIELRNKVIFVNFKTQYESARGDYDTVKEAKEVFNKLADILLHCD